MIYLKLFFTLIYHGIRARVYLWALEYVVDYQHSKPPLTIIGGGKEWPVKSIETLLDEAAEEGWPV